jgi:hypothetical protein
MTELREEFKAAGFEIVDGGSVSGSIGVRKYGFVWYLEPKADQQWLAPGPPYFQIRGLDCELEDHGYQKFWRHGDTRFPIRKTDLLRSLYNESLGSTCARTVYDRLEGRPDR